MDRVLTSIMRGVIIEKIRSKSIFILMDKYRTIIGCLFRIFYLMTIPLKQSLQICR